MSQATVGRRTVRYATLDDVMVDVDRLLQGHETIGKWSLGQMCNHLSETLRGSLEGFDAKVPWILRALLGGKIKRSILSTGRMREGIKLPDRFLPKAGLDARAEAEALRAAIAHYKSHVGPMAPHPMFGAMTYDEWTKLHLIHAAHHLSFARPK